MVDDIRDRFTRRDYTKESIGSGRRSPPKPVPEKAFNTSVRVEEKIIKFNRKPPKKVALAGLIIIVAIVIGTFLWTGRSKSPIPLNIRDNVKFPLYYPSNLPDGLEVDRSSFSATHLVVTYIIKQNGKSKFYVSIQPLPFDFDFQKFKNKFFDTDEFVTDIGNCFVGDIGSGLIGSIRTKDNSWILINTGDYSTPTYKLLEGLERTFQKV